MKEICEGFVIKNVWRIMVVKGWREVGKWWINSVYEWEGMEIWEMLIGEGNMNIRLERL